MCKRYLISTIAIAICTACNPTHNKEIKEEIAASYTEALLTDSDTLANSIMGNTTMNDSATYPAPVIITGIDNEKLLPIYGKQKNTTASNNRKQYSSYETTNYSEYEHYMPGLDVLYGYKLLNIAHYNSKENKLSYFFKTAALIKTVYYPSTIQDSINMQPINRNYYLVTVYNDDTNKDSLINKKDLRRMYCINANNAAKTLLIPKEYSVKKSQYDFKDDFMYIYAQHDSNHNGTISNNEPMCVFYINLKQTTVAVKMY
jgi:hypothetical protein